MTWFMAHPFECNRLTSDCRAIASAMQRIVTHAPGQALVLVLIGCHDDRRPPPESSPSDTAPIVSDGAWRSALSPEDWTPAFTDAEGRFLHDFSYAGYRAGDELPEPP